MLKYKKMRIPVVKLSMFCHGDPEGQG